MITPTIKTAMITGGIGLLAVLAVLALLILEKNSHADTKQKLADEKSLLASVREQHATIAADRAQDAENELARMRAQLDAFHESEQLLRRDLSAVEQLREADRLASETRIERLKRENEELMAWAVGLVPPDWIDFMREPVDQVAAATTGN